VFVAIEGIEGSGKSTVVAGLAAALRAGGHEVVVTREPGGTPAGDAIREIFLSRDVAISPLAESFLVNAARAQHVRDVIRPALEAGKLVLCDRFTDSTLAYQGYGRGVDIGLLQALCAAAVDGLEPMLTLLLDVPLAVARVRMTQRSANEDRIESEGDAFHQRVRRGFLELAKSPRHRVLDGTLAPKRVVESALREIVEARVP
jgi:dTMP kinase